jgi:hypothetical protein
MTTRARLIGMALLGVGLGVGSTGCSKSPAGSSTPTDADFSVCSGTPAVHFAPGMSVPSASGAYIVSIESALAVLDDGSTIPIAAIGNDTFSIAVTMAPAGGADAGATAASGGDAPSGLNMTSTSLPWMPVHMHGASTLPTVTAQSGGFSVAGIDFFMGGYWQLPLNLVPAGGTADTALFSICIPDD